MTINRRNLYLAVAYSRKVRIVVFNQLIVIPTSSLCCGSISVVSPSQGGWGGGATCALDPLIFLDFIPCFPFIKPIVPKNVFSSCFLDPENFCVVPLIPKNVYHCSPYLFACFTFVFIVEKNCFRTASFFSMASAHAVLHRLPFLSSQLTQLLLRQ